MLSISINHITAPKMNYRHFLSLAAEIGCLGVEFRNDLGRPLFDGDKAYDVARVAEKLNIKILGLSQIYPFNVWSNQRSSEVKNLIRIAKECNAETISLIPRNDGKIMSDSERVFNLKTSLLEIAELLDSNNITALIEPLGFQTSSLRSKKETVELIQHLGITTKFKLIHDTFHHFLAGEGEIFPEYTGIVHVSGVTDEQIDINELRDEHRVLINERDRIENVTQIRALQKAGYTGPISFEVFSPKIHNLKDITLKIKESIIFLNQSIISTEI